MNTMETYRKINQWTSQPRDIVESFKRYYNNSFLDKQRQEAYNLFLGNYIFAQGQPMLWDLSTDYYLHHADPRAWFARKRRSYKKWFTPGNLSTPLIPDIFERKDKLVGRPPTVDDEWWNEFYRPHQLEELKKLLPLKIRSTNDHETSKETSEERSPFRIREVHEISSPGKQRSRKNITNANPTSTSGQGGTSLAVDNGQIQPLHAAVQRSPLETEEALHEGASKGSKSHKDQSAQWTLDQFVANSLDPSVAVNEAHEYQRYVNHPLNLPLVVSTQIPHHTSAELLSYVNSVSLDAVTKMHSTEDDLVEYAGFLDVGDEPLTVTEADTAKKRYKAYRQWVKGKSLFKQRVDP